MLSQEDREIIGGFIRETVNGKIDRLQKTVEENGLKRDLEHNLVMGKIGDLETKVQPMFETYSDLGGFRKIMLSVSIVVGSLTGFGVGAVQLYRSFKGL